MKPSVRKKIIKAKQLNQSASARMKNLNIRSSIIGRVINERTKITPEDQLIVLDDYYKCWWYSQYKVLDNGELCKAYGEIYKEYILLNKSVITRGRFILKLRGNKWLI